MRIIPALLVLLLIATGCAQRAPLLHPRGETSVTAPVAAATPGPTTTSLAVPDPGAVRALIALDLLRGHVIAARASAAGHHYRQAARHIEQPFGVLYARIRAQVVAVDVADDTNLATVRTQYHAGLVAQVDTTQLERTAGALQAALSRIEFTLVPDAAAAAPAAVRAVLDAATAAYRASLAPRSDLQIAAYQAAYGWVRSATAREVSVSARLPPVAAATATRALATLRTALPDITPPPQPLVAPEAAERAAATAAASLQQLEPRAANAVRCHTLQDMNGELWWLDRALAGGNLAEARREWAAVQQSWQALPAGSAAEAAADRNIAQGIRDLSAAIAGAAPDLSALRRQATVLHSQVGQVEATLATDDQC